MNILLLVALFAAVAAAPLSAQSEDVLRPKGRPGSSSSDNTTSSSSRPITIGIEAGLNFNFFGQDISRQPFVSGDPTVTNSPEEVLGSGFGVSPTIGVFVDVPVSSSIGIQGRVAYDRKSYGNTRRGVVDAFVQQTPVRVQPIDGSPNLPSNIHGFNDGIVAMDTEAEVSFAMNTIAVAVIGRFDIWKSLYVTFGPYAHFVMGDATRTDTWTWIGPDSTFISVDYNGVRDRYTQISRERNRYQNFLPAVGDPDQIGAYEQSTFASARIGLELGAGYRFNLSRTVYLAPNIRYQLMLTPLTAEFQASDIGSATSQGVDRMTFGEASLNSLVAVLQLGIRL
ncbi:MAG TPA: hypothetical protein DIS79_05940 [Bacteroidetes bacterium]|nr:hypothetical protein [Bacteroidota bacterium]HRK04500.1 outer membrane beta-barrel protein [Chlorobiota bacterium]